MFPFSRFTIKFRSTGQGFVQCDRWDSNGLPVNPVKYQKDGITPALATGGGWGLTEDEWAEFAAAYVEEFGEQPNA